MKLESITIRINEIEKEQLKQIAAELDVPMSQLIRQAIKKFIQEEQTKWQTNKQFTANA